MIFTSLGRFLCSLGLHSSEEDPTYAFFECRRCGKIRDFTYPPGWRGFMKPRRPEKESKTGIGLKPTPAERTEFLSESKGYRIEHLARESLR